MSEISDETRQALRTRCPTPEEVDVLLVAYEERDEAVALLRTLRPFVKYNSCNEVRGTGFVMHRPEAVEAIDALLRRVGGSDER